MSYGPYGSGSGGRPRHDNGKERDRDTNRIEKNDRGERIDRNDRNDRSYNSRSFSSSKRYPQSTNYYNQSYGNSSRRPESRDFYGYKSVSSRPQSNGRGQGAPTSEISNVNNVRRDRNANMNSDYGPRSRPGTAKPRGPSQGQNFVPNQRQPNDHNQNSFGPSRREPRVESRQNNYTRGSVDNRRGFGRKQDWNVASGSRSRDMQYDQYGQYSTPRDMSSKSMKDVNALKYTEADHRAYLNSAPKGLRNNDSTALSNNNSRIPHITRPGSVPSLSSNNNMSIPQTPTPSSVPPIPSSNNMGITQIPLASSVSSLPKEKEGIRNRDSDDKPTRHTSKSPISEKPKPIDQDTMSSAISDLDKTTIEMQKVNDKLGLGEGKNRKQMLHQLFDDVDEASSKTVDSKIPFTKSDIPQVKNSGVLHMDDAPKCPQSPGSDISVLSPVGPARPAVSVVPSSPTPAVISEPTPLEQRFPKSYPHSDDQDDSEAETVVEDEDIDMSKARSYLRKNSRGKRSKRKNRFRVLLSDDEDDQFEHREGGALKTLDSKAQEDRDLLTEPIATKVECLEPELMKDAYLSSEPDSHELFSVAEKEKLKREKLDVKIAYKMKRDSTGRSQLQRACKKGDIQEVQRLLQQGGSANESDFGGFTCLHEAALAGHTEIIELLIAHGADVNKQAFEAGNYETPLMDAAENKHLESVRALLKNGADPHLCNNEGYSTVTKLFHLQENDTEYEDVIKIINDFVPPQMNSELNNTSHTQRKIIEDPSESYFAELVKKKSQSLIYKYAAQGNKESAAEDFVTNGFSLSEMPDVLNLAARNGHVELVDILLGLNPGVFDINHVNKIGVTVLLATAGRGYYEVVKFLLSRGADARIKRLKDGLTALEIAKHSPQYDPREVVVLEESLQGALQKANPDKKIVEGNKKDAIIGVNSSAQSANLEVSKSEEIVPFEVSSKTSRSNSTTRISSSESSSKLSEPIFVPSTSDNSTSNRSATPDYKDDQNQNVPKPSTPKRKPSLDDLHVSKKAKPNQSPDSHDQKPSNSNGDKIDISKEPVRDAQSSSPVDHSNSPVAIAETSPSGLSSTVQEEQKARAAEQAKIWQQKMQAKKKARKEMFLQAEKEKERARKEEEEKRLELMKRQQVEEQEKKRKDELEAKRVAEETKKNMQIMEQQRIIEAYPIGLQQVMFDGHLTKEERLKYTPLYVFEFENDNWVIDLQVSLFLSTPINHLHSKFEKQLGPSIDDSSKDKLWSLFFQMVGIGKNNVIESNGMEKFRHLNLRYVRLSEVGDWMKLQFSGAHDILWKENRLAKVNLASLDIARTKDSRRNSIGSASRASDGFIPPRFRRRGDVVRIIETANSPLW